MDAVVGPLILHHRIQPIVLHLAAPQPIVLPCAAPKGHGKQSSFPCAKGWHTAKRCLCRVSFVALGKIIKFFFSSHFKTFSILHIQHVVLHVKIWYIFVFILYI